MPRRYLAAIACSTLLPLMNAMPARATDWHVERDGSGDFETIQAAVDAAEDGDTILIGPGDYVEVHTVTLPGQSQPTAICVEVAHEDLTFRGVGRDEVSVGPGAVRWDERSVVFLGADRHRNWRIEGLTIQNAQTGIEVGGSLDLSDCRLRACRLGVFALNAQGVDVADCAFEGNDWGGVGCYDLRFGNASVRNCQFTDSSLHFTGRFGALVEDCTFSGGEFGIRFTGTQGAVVGTVVAGMSGYGIKMLSNETPAAVSLDACDIRSAGPALDVQRSSVVAATSCRLQGADSTTVRIASGARLTVNLCDIYRAQDWFVECTDWAGHDGTVLDFTGNYWDGTGSPDDIADGIWDGADSEDVPVVIIFEPYVDDAMPTETASWGDVKALYRGR